MVGKPHHHGSSSLVAEELNLLHGGGDGGRGGGGLGQWKCRLLGSLAGLGRPRRAVRRVPPGAARHRPPRRRKGAAWWWGGAAGAARGAHVAGARVARAAAFDEVFLNYFVAGGATLRSFAVWAALVDDPASTARGGGDLGSFPVDLTEIATAESSNPRFGGKALSFPLGGAAAGAVLTVSVYCRVMEHEENHGGANGNKEETKP